ncbi:MAG: hypothetical protein HY922_01490 [Elusimicrobia bacterium]|nr:hypothetical protein [Elusimicrobiota bacterium]
MRTSLAMALVVFLAGNSFAAYLLQYTITPKDSNMVTGSATVKSGKTAKVKVGDKTVAITARKEGKDSVKLSVKVIGKDEKGKKKTLWSPSVVSKLGAPASMSSDGLMTIVITPSEAGPAPKAKPRKK